MTVCLSADYTHSSPPSMYLVIFQFLGAWKISCWLFSASQNVLLLSPTLYFLILVLPTHFHSTNLLSSFCSPNSVSIICFPLFPSSSLQPLCPRRLQANVCLTLFYLSQLRSCSFRLSPESLPPLQLPLGSSCLPASIISQKGSKIGFLLTP